MHCQQHGKLNPMQYATGGTTMPVGTVSGEPVLKLLICSVAANTQALEEDDALENGTEPK